MLRGEPVGAFAVLVDLGAERLEQEWNAALTEQRTPTLASVTRPIRAGGAPRLPGGMLGWFDHVQASILGIESGPDGQEQLVEWIPDQRLRNDLSAAVTARRTSIPPATGSMGSVVPLSLSPALSQSLPPGRYVLRCSFNSTQAEDEAAWHGVLGPIDTRFEVVEPQGAQVQDVALRRASYHLNRGSPADALSDLDDLVASGSERQLGWSLRLRKDLQAGLAALESELDPSK